MITKAQLRHLLFENGFEREASEEFVGFRARTMLTRVAKDVYASRLNDLEHETAPIPSIKSFRTLVRNLNHYSPNELLLCFVKMPQRQIAAFVGLDKQKLLGVLEAYEIIAPS